MSRYVVVDLVFESNINIQLSSLTFRCPKYERKGKKKRVSLRPKTVPLPHILKGAKLIFRFVHSPCPELDPSKGNSCNAFLRNCDGAYIGILVSKLC